MSAPNNIILYNYGFSPFGKRISDYLAFRGIDYALCEQPFVLPRPDLALLPVNYRRIPILAIGREIYLDTRVMLRKLESLPDMPSAPLGATNGPDRFTEKLIEKYIIEGPVFEIAAGLVPVEMAQDPAFNKDRQGLLNRNWSREELEEGKGECLNYIRNLYNFYETTILEDGRDWILGSEGPKLADIEAIFMLEFVNGFPLPEDIISKRVFPKTFAWVERYRAALERAKSNAAQVKSLDGEAAAKHIHASRFGQRALSVDGGDPAGLKEGSEVQVYPADWLTGHRDQGRLVGLTPDEVTIAVKSKGDVEIRIHAPRAGFKIKEA